MIIPGGRFKRVIDDKRVKSIEETKGYRGDLLREVENYIENGTG